MKEADTDYQRTDQLLKERSVKISSVVWQKLPCLALQSSLRLFGILIIHTLFQREKKPRDCNPNGDN